MDEWLKVAKERAKIEAEYFCHEIETIANEENIDVDWFYTEVLNNIHKIRKGAEMGEEE